MHPRPIIPGYRIEKEPRVDNSRLREDLSNSKVKHRYGLFDNANFFVLLNWKAGLLWILLKIKARIHVKVSLLWKGFRIATSGNKERLVMTLSDSDDSIDAVMWSPFPEIYFDNGDIAYVEGKLSDYNNKPQITLTKIRHTNDSDEFDFDSLLPTIKQDRNELYDRCIELASSVEDKVTQI